MSRLGILIVIVMTFTLNLKLEAKKIEGKIIFENDTIDVVFDIPLDLLTREVDIQKLQYKVMYYDSTGKKIRLNPSKAKEIQFMYEYENFRMMSRTVKKDMIFLKLAIDGQLKLFNYYYTQVSAGGPGPSSMGYSYSADNFFFQKGDEELKMFKKLTLRKEMIDYFSDCPTLVEKIENKDFRRNDLESIASFYNSNCR